MFIESIVKRVRALLDKSAWLMILPCLIVLYFVDESMLVTVIQWLLVAPIITGLAVFISRLMFPQIELTKLVTEAHGGNKAAGIVVAGLLAFTGLLILALVMWAKA
ncbi:hypothetical protein fHeYen801_028 [Yersinia phage fHe-Yen8-01]|nr:hypothetical protein fHeYen801_028 [Yersinia phage fHe-Yen8-01]